MDVNERRIMMEDHYERKMGVTLPVIAAQHLFEQVLSGRSIAQFAFNGRVHVVNFAGLKYVDFLFEDSYND